MVFDKVHHLLLGPSVNGSAFDLQAFLCTEILDQLICAETLMALFTIHQRIRKSSQMSGSDPCLRVHKDGTVNAYIIRRLLNKFLPPGTLYVIL